MFQRFLQNVVNVSNRKTSTASTTPLAEKRRESVITTFRNDVGEEASIALRDNQFQEIIGLFNSIKEERSSSAESSKLNNSNVDKSVELLKSCVDKMNKLRLDSKNSRDKISIMEDTLDVALKENENVWAILNSICKAFENKDDLKLQDLVSRAMVSEKNDKEKILEMLSSELQSKIELIRQETLRTILHGPGVNAGDSDLLLKELNEYEKHFAAMERNCCNGTIENLENPLDQLKKNQMEIVRLFQNISLSQNQEIHNLNTVVKEQEAEIVGLKSRNNENDLNFKNLLREIEDLRGNLKVSKETIESLNYQVQNLTSHNSELLKDLEIKKSEVEARDNALKKLNSEKSSKKESSRKKDKEINSDPSLCLRNNEQIKGAQSKTLENPEAINNSNIPFESKKTVDSSVNIEMKDNDIQITGIDSWKRNNDITIKALEKTEASLLISESTNRVLFDENCLLKESLVKIKQNTEQDFLNMEGKFEVEVQKIFERISQKTAFLQEIKQNISLLRNSSKALKSEHEMFKEKNDMLEKEISKLNKTIDASTTKSLREYQNKLKEHEAEYAEFQKIKMMLQNHVSELNSDIEKQKREIKDYKTKIQELDKHINVFKDNEKKGKEKEKLHEEQIKKLSIELNEKNILVEDQKTTLKTLEHNLQINIKGKEDVIEEVFRIKSSLEGKELDICRLNKELEDKECLVKTLETEINQKSELLHSLVENELQTFKREIEQKEIMLNNSSRKSEILESEMKKLHEELEKKELQSKQNMEDLVLRSDNLNNEYSKKSLVLEEVLAKSEILKEQVHKLEDEMSLKEETINSLNSKIEKAAGDLDNLQGKFNVQEQEISEKQMNILKLETELNVHLSLIQTHQLNIKSLENDLMIKSTTLEKTIKEFKMQEAKLMNLEVEFDNKRRNLEALQEENGNQKNLVQTLEKNVKEKDFQIEELRTNCVSQLAQIESMEIELGQKVTQMKNLDAEINEKKSDLAVFHQEAEKQKELIQKLGQAVIEKDFLVDELRIKCETQSCKLKTIESELEQKATALNHLEIEIKEKNDVLLVFQQKAENQCIITQEYEKDVKEKDFQFCKLKMKYESLSSKIKELENELEEKCNLLQETSQKAELHKSELMKLESRLSVEKENYEKQIEKKNTQVSWISETEKVNKDLAEENRFLRESFISLAMKNQEEYDKLNSEFKGSIEGVLTKLEQHRQSVELIKDKNCQLKRSNTLLISEKTDMERKISFLENSKKEMEKIVELCHSEMKEKERVLKIMKDELKEYQFKTLEYEVQYAEFQKTRGIFHTESISQEHVISEQKKKIEELIIQKTDLEKRNDELESKIFNLLQNNENNDLEVTTNEGFVKMDQLLNVLKTDILNFQNDVKDLPLTILKEEDEEKLSFELMRKSREIENMLETIKILQNTLSERDALVESLKQDIFTLHQEWIEQRRKEEDNSNHLRGQLSVKEDEMKEMNEMHSKNMGKVEESLNSKISTIEMLNLEIEKIKNQEDVEKQQIWTELMSLKNGINQFKEKLNIKCQNPLEIIEENIFDNFEIQELNETFENILQNLTSVIENKSILEEKIIAEKERLSFWLEGKEATIRKLTIDINTSRKTIAELEKNLRSKFVDGKSVQQDEQNSLKRVSMQYLNLMQNYMNEKVTNSRLLKRVFEEYLKVHEQEKDYISSNILEDLSEIAGVKKEWNGRLQRLFSTRIKDFDLLPFFMEKKDIRKSCISLNEDFESNSLQKNVDFSNIRHILEVELQNELKELGLALKKVEKTRT